MQNRRFALEYRAFLQPGRAGIGNGGGRSVALAGGQRRK